MRVGSNTQGLTSTRLASWFSALDSADTDLLDDLLVHGVPVDVPHPLRHSTALMEATRQGRTEIVRFLLERGAAPVFLCGLPLGTPLHCALHLRHWEIAQLLVQASDKATVTDAYGCTLLHALCREATFTDSMPAILVLAKALLVKGCSLDAFDHDGATALHHCVINNLPELAELLLVHGANPNALTPTTSVSPLTIAALEKNLFIAALLLRHGADPHLKTYRGLSAATMHPAIMRLTRGSTVQTKRLLHSDTVKHTG